jgi:hypothetical protein
MIAWRIERNAIRPRQSGGKNTGLLRFSVSGNPAKHFDFAGAALCEKKIAVGSSADEPRIIESIRIELYGESVWCFWPSAVRARYQLRSVVRGVGGIWRREIFNFDLANRSRLLKPKIDKRRLRRRSVGHHRRETRRPRSTRSACGGILERLHKTNQLPSLLLRKHAPRRHAVIHRSRGNDPENLAVRNRLRGPF